MIPARALLLVSVIVGALGAAPRANAMGVPTSSPAVVSRGSGPTVVLLSGLLGGTARLAPLADRLVSSGFRVVAIDPYRLSANEHDVSFDGLARSVARALQGEGVRSATVVAHAHASGIALRLAANHPTLASELVLLDAGVMGSTRSAGITRAMRLASLVSRLPGGHSLIRNRLSAGIRENSGNPEWLSDAVARDYADPILAELPAVARMAERLAVAREPEPVELVLTRVQLEVTALIGAAPHGFATSDEEIALLVRVPGARLRRLHGVGHFVHEEAAQVVVQEVLAAHARREGRDHLHRGPR
jgi:pimeloyl-ACP methyl ester carboxylesterase